MKLIGDQPLTSAERNKRYREKQKQLNPEKCKIDSRNWMKKHPGYVGPKRQAIVNRVNILKESIPCTDCGGFFPACCMDYDHVFGLKNGKREEVGSLIASAKTWERIQLEIDKCELVCSNCHRIRTKNRKITYKPRRKTNVK